MTPCKHERFDGALCVLNVGHSGAHAYARSTRLPKPIWDAAKAAREFRDLGPEESKEVADREDTYVIAHMLGLYETLLAAVEAEMVR